MRWAMARSGLWRAWGSRKCYRSRWVVSRPPYSRPCPECGVMGVFVKERNTGVFTARLRETQEAYCETDRGVWIHG